MNSKVICFFVLIAAVHSAPQHDQPARYPAGVNPALCPGFPICDNSLLHGTPPVPAAPHAAYTGSPAWNHGAQSYAYHSAPAYNQWNQPQHYDAHDYDYSTNDINGPGGDKYPAGVNPSACPNYPYCDNGAASHYAPVATPLAGYASRQYPAGISPAACPNYPYCA
ncbi:cuticle protein 1 [Sitodiplosis mosellana]|uniref:cuticle protein 1 n=1 Tax=Sitodiplosis mosellana TaxID=263140 RepID=UPI0024437499|nr:cuticle protein 1 [Sitodiplosis mosellana]